MSKTKLTEAHLQLACDILVENDVDADLNSPKTIEAAEWIADSEKRAIEARDKIILETAMDLYDANKKIRVLRKALLALKES